MRLEYSKQAGRTLKKLNKSDKTMAQRIVKAVKELQEGKGNAESLSGHSDYKKSRVGKYRIITTIFEDETADNEQVLRVFIVEKRETVYETFNHFLRTQGL